MVRESELHAADDKTTRKDIEIRNNADALLYTTEKLLREHTDRITATDKRAVEGTSAELRKALEGAKTADIESATEKLTQATHRLAEAMYAASSAQNDAASGGRGPESAVSNGNGGVDEAGRDAGDNGPVDADFAVVDDDTGSDSND